MAGGLAIGRTIGVELPERTRWLVPTIIQLELSKWLSEIALLAAEPCARHNLPTAHSIVYATALSHDADLITCDRHFRGPGR